MKCKHCGEKIEECKSLLCCFKRFIHVNSQSHFCSGSILYYTNKDRRVAELHEV
jgi:hypothetical protein